MAESVKVYAEEAWERLEDLGWALPPPDGGSSPSNGVNPDSRYDIFTYDFFIDSVYETVGFTDEDGGFPDPYEDGRKSWIGIENNVLNYSPPIDKFDRLKALVAHEVHHASQYRYTTHDFPVVYPKWFMENSAVWFEDIVYDDVNTLYHRFDEPGQDPINDPHVRINHISPTPQGLYEYAGALWPTFLHERYGPNLVREIWHRIGEVPGENTIEAINTVLSQEAYGSSLAQALKEYAVWRYFTGDRADEENFFSEGSSYPEAPIHTTQGTYTATGNHGSLLPQSPGGVKYHLFTSPPLSSPITFTGQSNRTWAAMVIGDRLTVDPSFFAEITLNASQSGTAKFLTSNVNRIVLAPVIVADSLLVSGTYSYTVATLPANQIVNYSRPTGWGMMSIPNVIPNFVKTTAYPTATSAAWAFQLSPIYSYVSRDTLSNTEGYWISFSGGTESDTGAPYDIAWLPVDSAWNIIGSMKTTIKTNKIFPSRGISTTSYYWKYNGSYSAVDSITPGQAPWIKVSDDGYLTYNPTATTNAPPPSTTDPNPPPAPGGLSAPILSGAVSGGHPYLSWSSVSGASMYRLYRYECVGPSDCDLIGSLRYEGTTRYYTDLQIQVGNKFDSMKVWYYVRAVDYFDLTSPKSNKISFWKDGYEQHAGLRQPPAVDESIPETFVAYPNYPNPFNPVTRIRYDLPEDSHVSLTVHDILGRLVGTLVHGNQGAGRKSVDFDGSGFPSGIYVYRLQAGSFSQTGKMLLTK